MGKETVKRNWAYVIKSALLLMMSIVSIARSTEDIAVEVIFIAEREKRSTSGVVLLGDVDYSFSFFFSSHLII
ncbi:hypothetical protein [Shouchella miscanthi]|uniref:hypothetical protein n=1 Tax=Shouchella miscanthi TaxID=2598861 RepID=UPI0011A7535E|nr:hypothetical protein [Shouchella miscanthi]